jgi:hypothetical protein
MYGEKKLALLDYDRASEYVGDDVDRVSALVDLGQQWKWVLVFVPVIETATVGLLGQLTDSIAEVPFAVPYQKTDNTTAAWALSSGTGLTVVPVYVGGLQYVRVQTTNANQTANRSFYVQGFN